MKKIIFLFFISAICQRANSQQSFTYVNDVYNAQNVMFYGYDYTKLRIADASRIGQPLKKFFPSLTTFFSKEIPPKKMQAWLKKETVTFDIMAINAANERINNGKIATQDPVTFPVDSLKSSVNNLEIKEKEGIGSLVVMECFDREAKTVSAYLVFFDIASGKILYNKHVVSKNNNGYNYMGDWKAASYEAVEKLYDGYRDDRKAFLKPEPTK